MDYRGFIERAIVEIRTAVGNGVAISALSGGVDSSTVTVLGHRALGEKMRAFFVDSGLMREGEPKRVVETLGKLGVRVSVVDARNEFLSALRGIVDPEEKREAITTTFYSKVFGRLVRETGAKFVLQGTNLTDIEETVARIKRQHNVLEQLGINPEEAFGYKVLEPLVTLRKDGVREAARLLGLPSSISEAIPFPGPALSARIVGEVTAERLKTVRAATVIVEEELADSGAFQYLAVLLNDRATGVRENKREFGQIIVVRCVNSIDARTATATQIPWPKLERICQRITTEVEGVAHCLYDLTPKPPATIEYV
jgi:GMP synthase (glutamine-hydrolysing)